MAWTTPHTFSVGEVLSASTMNTYVSDDLTDLDRRTTTTGAVVATSETTSSTSFANLATTGPAVTVTIGSTGLATVGLSVAMSNNTAGGNSSYAFAVSGASTVAASNSLGIGACSSGANQTYRIGTQLLQTSLTAGSNTFTAKYAVGANTSAYADRRITVTPLGS